MQEDPEVKDMARQFRTNRYSDNIIGGAETASKAVRHCQEAKKMSREASMNLREFYTSSNEVRENIPPVDRGQAVVLPKVLGVQWNVVEDTLTCCGLLNKGPNIVGYPNKRKIAREVAQVFDLSGWFSPVPIMGKKLIQDIWRMGSGWYEPIIADVAGKWEAIQSEY